MAREALAIEENEQTNGELTRVFAVKIQLLLILINEYFQQET